MKVSFHLDRPDLYRVSISSPRPQLFFITERSKAVLLLWSSLFCVLVSVSLTSITNFVPYVCRFKFSTFVLGRDFGSACVSIRAQLFKINNIVT